MNLKKWLLAVKKAENRKKEAQWEELVYQHDDLNVFDEEERRKYLEECLQQMGDASREIEALSGEYNLVTSYLTDMEELEQLPEKELEELRTVCTRMTTLGAERSFFKERKSRMSDEAYKNMARREEEAEEGIRKITEAEDYQELIRQDLRRLDGEKSAFYFRKNELENELVNLKGVAVIVLGAIVFCFVLLLILQLALSFDTRLGYLLAGAMAAVVITILYLKYTESDRELNSVNSAINRLIQLHNTVKIRYVNNTSLLEYLYVKYGVENGTQLKKLWKQYLEEKEERQKYRRTELELDMYEGELLKLLNHYKLKQPKRWLNQAAAILDPKEMVEIRHELIIRRQSLRKRLDYNKDVAREAKDEIMDLARAYPQYASEIQNMVDRYEKMY